MRRRERTIRPAVVLNYKMCFSFLGFFSRVKDRRLVNKFAWDDNYQRRMVCLEGRKKEGYSKDELKKENIFKIG